jgi:hypothetical protein
MRVAYLILGHTAPQQILRAIDRLRAPGALFVVHIDARADEAVHEALRGRSDVHLALRARCYWGTYGIVQATLNCVETLLALRQPFDYAVLLSGQDYPIKSPAAIAAFLEAHSGTEFIEAFPLDQPNRWTAQGGPFQAMARVHQYTFTLRSKTFHLKLPRRFYRGWQPHGGSQWWALSRPALEWVAEYLRAHPALARYYRRTFIPDESMLQTMLASSPFASRLSAQALHYIDWERPNPKYPRTLNDEDFDRVKAAPELFARKLNEVQSASLLTRIDQELLLQGPEQREQNDIANRP